MKDRFVLQWHLCEACNLKCTHCYQEDHRPMQLGREALGGIFDQFIELLDKLDSGGHISLTGGEPFLSPHLFWVMDKIAEEQKRGRDLTFSILTNGTLITKELAERVAAYEPEYVQVSIEGGKGMNDKARGKGSTDRATRGMDFLREAGIFVSVSFTATTMNFRDFPAAVKLARKHGANVVWSDRFIPIGGAASEKALSLSHKETEEYLDIMLKAREGLMRKGTGTTAVSMYRALQFKKTCDFPYGCAAGDTLLTVMENGDLVPCRRMPITVGNLLRENMAELYEKSPLLQELRQKSVPEECSGCEEAELCRGGLKCLAYAFYGDFNRREPGCAKKL